MVFGVFPVRPVTIALAVTLGLSLSACAGTGEDGSGSGVAVANASAGPAAGRTAYKGPRLFQVQIGSYRSSGDARRGWRRFVRRAPDLLEDLDPVIRKADGGMLSGDRFRLRTPPYRSQDDAEELCAELYEKGIECLIVEIPDRGQG